eukprot:scaffold17904_cov142-Skeletonema_marinoi.AAC.8
MMNMPLPKRFQEFTKRDICSVASSIFMDKIWYCSGLESMIESFPSRKTVVTSRSHTTERNSSAQRARTRRFQSLVSQKANLLLKRRSENRTENPIHLGVLLLAAHFKNISLERLTGIIRNLAIIVQCRFGCA